MTESKLVSRRLFLSTALSALAWSQARVDRSGLIVRAVQPEDLEMPASAFSGFITPLDDFFVRTHVEVPDVDLATWQLKIDGNVAVPLTLSIGDLKKMPSFELPAVLECAGNGRSFFEPPVAGIQWGNGAVGNGAWRGVRLRDVLARAQLKPGAVEVLFDGADVPIGAMADFQRSIPLKKAMDPATLLAYDMNGVTLPIKHGFPLRAIVPGWAGNSWVKWLTNIRVLTEPWDGFWMKNAYVYPSRPIAPGSTPSPDIMKPVTSLRVKSVAFSPAGGAVLKVSAPITIAGAAWSGDAGNITAVDVSTDRGRTWKPAKLMGAATPFGWRLWNFSWTPPAEGYYTVLTRARDSSGDVQPLLQEWNPSGYLWTAVGRVDVNVGIQPEKPTAIAPPANAPAPQGFRETCLVCHGDDVIRQQRLTRAQWDREINKMTAWGARLQPGQRDTFLDYLLSIAGPRRP